MEWQKISKTCLKQEILALAISSEETDARIDAMIYERAFFFRH